MTFLVLHRIFNLSQRTLQAIDKSQTIFKFNKQPKVYHSSKLIVFHHQPRLDYTTLIQKRDMDLKAVRNSQSHEAFHILKHQNYSCLNFRQCTHETNSESFEDRQFHLIYRFPYIVHARFLSRFKLYQTVFTVAAIPWALRMVDAGVITTQMFTGVIAYSVLACVMLYVLSIYFRRIIGMLYINRKDNIVKLSHMTFWGKRNDIYIHVEDIIPLSDLSDNPDDIFVRFKQYTTKDEFYLMLRFGGIRDLKLMKQLLGEIKIK